MKVGEARKLIGKRVVWEIAHDHHRGTYLLRGGVLQGIEGKNAIVDGDYKWLPDMRNLRLAEDE